MKLVYALVEKEIDATELDNINAMFDDVSDALDSYRLDTASGSCKYLNSALNAVNSAKNTMNEYIYSLLVMS
mgnify:CR=1 FL=1